MKVLQNLILILSLIFIVHPQSILGKFIEPILSGTVYDDNGAVVGGAIVKITGSDEKEFISKTNEEGVFEIRLFPGNYFIQVEMPGFQTFRLEKYRIAPSFKSRMNLDIVLEVEEVEPCGPAGSGDGCIMADPIDMNKTEIKISDKILQRPLEKLPKAQNKTKRKN